MRERELRIALVCFGGASLAIYMHGITKEILKLSRASSALHAIADRNKRSTAGFFDVRDRADPEYDTEAIYFDLLRDIGRTVDLRVIVDIVAGASAGGINAIMLARALSHDLPMGRLRDLWLEHADVSELLASEAKARVSSKWFLRPLFWAAGLAGLAPVADLEVRSKLSLFVRSRWFEPPFDGPNMTALMYDAVAAMGTGEETSSLLPSEQGLDLFVTLTDFNGYQRTMQLHNPPIIHEREHRHRLHFRYRKRPSGAIESDFEMSNAPALAFAARATSSIPGAFPPARIVEVDDFLRGRSIDWPSRADFIARNFENYARMNVDVAYVPFIDGSVLSSHPFREAVGAIRGRAAYREVDRRVVYVDPNPTSVGSVAHHRVPGFFPTLKGALSEIPLTQPVTDELGWVGQFNEHVRRLRGIVDSARPHVRRLVGEVIAIDGEQPVDAGRIRGWREQANVRAARDAGFAYDAYVRLKLASARDFVSRLIMEIRGVRPESPFARAIAEIINAWAIETGVTYEPAAGRSLPVEGGEDFDDTLSWVRFLLAFDVDYRKRRLRFLIEGQNRISQMLGSELFEGLDFAVVDRLKRRFYECTEALEQRETNASISSAARDLVEDIFRVGPSPAEVREIGNYARSFAARHKDRIDTLIEQLSQDIDLKAITSDIDVLLAETAGWPPLAMREVLVNYLGFPFWDIVTFPIMPWREAGEFNEVRVDRISAQDAVGISRLGEFPLKGTGFSQSAAFLSRAYRENDYLLGRLHAVDRLIDIVSEAADAETLSPAVVAALKRRGFLRVLDAEERHLPACKQLIAKLRAALAAEGQP
ncbi:MAG: patatin-like protein [Bradyrhizobium sp.]|uniref:patatin-like protein n=1 Tax=Bradyrhizobium sp. TaxID=376 RepID=UPI002A286DF3|nr:patatin-like protein [Bradyrhizobium sp.]